MGAQLALGGRRRRSLQANFGFLRADVAFKTFAGIEDRRHTSVARIARHIVAFIEIVTTFNRKGLAFGSAAWGQPTAVTVGGAVGGVGATVFARGDGAFFDRRRGFFVGKTLAFINAAVADEPRTSFNCATATHVRLQFTGLRRVGVGAGVA